MYKTAVGEGNGDGVGSDLLVGDVAIGGEEVSSGTGVDDGGGTGR